MVSSEALSKAEIFRGLEQDELSEIAALCREAEFEKDAFIFRESDTGRDFYLILEGAIGIEMEMPPGLEGWKKLKTLREGEMFGEMSFVTGLRRSAAARSLDGTRVLVIDGEALDRLFEERKDLGYVVMRHLAELLCRRLENAGFMWRDAVI